MLPYAAICCHGKRVEGHEQHLISTFVLERGKVLTPSIAAWIYYSLAVWSQHVLAQTKALQTKMHPVARNKSAKSSQKCWLYGKTYAKFGSCQRGKTYLSSGQKSGCNSKKLNDPSIWSNTCSARGSDAKEKQPFGSRNPRKKKHVKNIQWFKIGNLACYEKLTTVFYCASSTKKGLNIPPVNNSVPFWVRTCPSHISQIWEKMKK